MPETRFTPDHEWLRPAEAGAATVGITTHAQGLLGDIVFVELPAPGRVVAAGEAIATVESVKAASDVFAPVAGRIAAINAALADDPALVNRDAEGAGWLFSIVPDDAAALGGLLDRDAYAALVGAA